MNYKIAAIAEIFAAIVLVIGTLLSGLNAFANWRAWSNVTQGMLDLQLQRGGSVVLERLQDAAKSQPKYLPAKQALLYYGLNEETPDPEFIQSVADEILAQTNGVGRHAAAAIMAAGVMKFRQFGKAKSKEKKLEILKEADREFRRAAEAAPDNAGGLVNRALIALHRYLLLGKPRKSADLKTAKKLLIKAKKAEQISMNATLPLAEALGQVYLEEGKVDLALRELIRGAELDGTETVGFSNLAVAYTAMIEDKALSEDDKKEILWKAGQLVKPSSPVYYGLQCALGVLYYELKDYNPAESKFYELISKNKERSAAIANLGMLKFQVYLLHGRKDRPQGPVSDVFESMYTALQLKDITLPARARCLNIMARCRIMGYPFDPETAKPVTTPENYLRQAIQADPTYWAANRNLGKLLQDRREWKEALKYYRASLRGRDQEDLKRLVSLFQTPAKVGNPRFYPKSLQVQTSDLGVTASELPAIILTTQPSYPGRIELDASRIWIDGKLQQFKGFVTDDDILVVTQDYLPDGVHLFKAEIVDSGANRSHFEWKFAVDVTAPTIVPVRPKESGKFSFDELLEFQIQDASSGPNLRTLSVRMKSVNKRTAMTRLIHKGRYINPMPKLGISMGQPVTTSRVQIKLPRKFPAGKYVLTITVRDNAGLTGEKTVTFFMED